MQGGSVLPVSAQNLPVTTMVSGFQIPLVTAVFDVMKMQPDHFFLCSHLGNEKGVESRTESDSSGLAETWLNE